MALTELTTENFDAEVIKSKQPCIVDFWAVWCGPCRALGPVFEKLSNDFKGKLKFMKLNVDQNQELAAKYGVLSIPCMIMFSNGKEVDRFIGNIGEGELKENIGSALKKA